MNQKPWHHIHPSLILALCISCSSGSQLLRDDESAVAVPCGLDVHMHVGSPAVQSGNTQFDAERARLSAAAAGLSRAWLIASGYGAESEQKDVVRENDYVLDAATSDPGALVAVVAVPIGAPWASSELTRARLRGASVVKLHPVAAGTDLTSTVGIASLELIMAHAQAEGFTVLIHANFDDEQSAASVLEIARRHQAHTVILSHSFTRFHHLLRGVSDRHLFVDTSAVVAWPYFMSERKLVQTAAAAEFGHALVKSWRSFGIERVLFGSDMPFMSPSEALHLLQFLPLTQNERQQIVSFNAGALGVLGPSCKIEPSMKDSFNAQ